MKPLSIAFIGQKGLPARWGGVEAHVDAIATRLAARGHHVTAYVRRWYSGTAARSWAGVALRPLPTVRTKHLDAALHSALAAADAVLRGFDVVHFQAHGPALFCWLPRLRAERVVVTLHALDYRQAKWGPVAQAALRTGEQLALRLADEIVVVSRELEAHVRRLGRAPVFIPNGVEPAPPEPPHRIGAFGLTGGDYVLFLGRWIRERQLVEAVEAWRAAGPWPWRLVLAGDDPDAGPYGRAVRRAAAGAADIVMPGMVEGALKRELLSNAAAVLAPSRHEGLPIALLEALSAGRVVVASDIAPHREAFGETGAGLCFPASEPSALAPALRQLARLTPEDLSARGERGRERVLREYSWDAAVDRLEAMYARITG